MLTIELIKKEKNNQCAALHAAARKKEGQYHKKKNEFDMQHGIFDNFLQFEDLFRILTLAHRRFVPQLAHL